MSLQTPPSTAFKSLFDAALHNYFQQTGVDLINHRPPDSDKLESCHSPEDFIQLLSERKTEFTNYRGKYRKLIDPLVPVVKVAHTISGVLSAAAGLVSHGHSIAVI
jgi:STAND-like protein